MNLSSPRRNNVDNTVELGQAILAFVCDCLTVCDFKTLFSITYVDVWFRYHSRSCAIYCSMIEFQQMFYIYKGVEVHTWFQWKSTKRSAGWLKGSLKITLFHDSLIRKTFIPIQKTDLQKKSKISVNVIRNTQSIISAVLIFTNADQTIHLI